MLPAPVSTYVSCPKLINHDLLVALRETHAIRPATQIPLYYSGRGLYPSAVVRRSILDNSWPSSPETRPSSSFPPLSSGLMAIFSQIVHGLILAKEKALRNAIPIAQSPKSGATWPSHRTSFSGFPPSTFSHPDACIHARSRKIVTQLQIIKATVSPQTNILGEFL